MATITTTTAATNTTTTTATAPAEHGVQPPPLSSSLRKIEGDVSKLMDEFCQDCRDRHLTEETIGRYRSPLKIFFAFLKKEGKTLSDVDKYVLRNFIHFRREQGVDQKTLENNFTALSTFYEFLCFEEYASANPVLAVRKRYLKRYKDEDDGGGANNSSFDESARKLATVEEMAMLVHSILSVRDQAVVLMLAKTGLRRNELASIDIEDDDDGSSSISSSGSSKNDGGRRSRSSTTNSRTGDIDWVEQSITLKRKKFKKRSGRTVFFDDETARVLRRWEAQRKKLNPKTKALFVNEYGERLGRNGIYNLVTKYAEAVGLHNPNSNRVEDHFSTHNCRHWFTTWLRRNGMPREFIKALRGDKRKDAMDIYDHIDREELRKAYLACIPQLGID